MYSQGWDLDLEPGLRVELMKAEPTSLDLRFGDCM